MKGQEDSADLPAVDGAQYIGPPNRMQAIGGECWKKGKERKKERK